MAYFEKRGNAWRAQIRRKGYPILSATFDTKADAQRWAAGIEGDMSRDQFVDSREAMATTLSDALKRYRREVSDHKKGARQEAVRIEAWLKDPLADKPIGALTSSDLAAYRDTELKSGKSPATVRLNLAIISHLFTVAAKEWGMIGLNNPCKNMRMPKGSSARDRRPTSVELKCLYDAAADIHHELPIIIELAADTAMRRSELVLLRVYAVGRDRAAGCSNSAYLVTKYAHCY